jgi:hypothetical protein
VQSEYKLTGWRSRREERKTYTQREKQMNEREQRKTGKKTERNMEWKEGTKNIGWRK